MTKDVDAFVAWLNEDMFGSDGSKIAHRDFAAKHDMRTEDLKWAFCSGRMSARQEQVKAGK